MDVVESELNWATFEFERDRLSTLATEWSEQYEAGSPFPHVVIDDLLPDELIDVINREFPEPEERNWQQFDQQTEIKLALADTTQMGPVTRNLLREFNGQVFVEFLEQLTGIPALIPDPYYDGGGLHQIRRSGFLKIHADFNRHEKLRLDRRLNALLYLNRDWEEGYGGCLELWDRSMTNAVQVIPPVANRLVVFSTTDFAYHGHPQALTCPPDRARRSMALYYYTNGRPADEVSASHTTLFQARPGERLTASTRDRLVRWTPPAIHDWLRARQHRR